MAFPSASDPSWFVYVLQTESNSWPPVYLQDWSLPAALPAVAPTSYLGVPLALFKRFTRHHILSTLNLMGCKPAHASALLSWLFDQFLAGIAHPQSSLSAGCGTSADGATSSASGARPAAPGDVESSDASWMRCLSPLSLLGPSCPRIVRVLALGGTSSRQPDCLGECRFSRALRGACPHSPTLPDCAARGAAQSPRVFCALFTTRPRALTPLPPTPLPPLQ